MIYYLLFSICESISNQRLPKIYNLRLIYKNLDILSMGSVWAPEINHIQLLMLHALCQNLRINRNGAANTTHDVTDT